MLALAFRFIGDQENTKKTRKKNAKKKEKRTFSRVGDIASARVAALKSTQNFFSLSFFFARFLRPHSNQIKSKELRAVDPPQEYRQRENWESK
jgi:hypothetical protein